MRSKEVASLEEDAGAVTEQMHKLLENKRHVLLQENIANIETTLAKLKTKIRPLPKEVARDASSAEQDKYKAEKRARWEAIVCEGTAHFVGDSPANPKGGPALGPNMGPGPKFAQKS